MENVNSQDMAECPYDKHHIILKTRMQVHLLRCRRNYFEGKKVTCPFNVTHVMNEPELNLHVTACPDRKILEHFKNDSEDTATPKTPPSMPDFQTDENWDDEPAAPSYNPQVYASSAEVLRCLKGATPSQRKEFRKQERLRLLGINK